MKGIYSLLIFALFSGACSKDEIILPELLAFTPAKGGAGNLVYLSGRSFGEDSSGVVIDFNGKPAMIRHFEDTLVVLEVPEGATTGKISYGIGGKRITTIESFTVLPGRWVRRKDLPVNFEPRGLGIGSDPDRLDILALVIMAGLPSKTSGTMILYRIIGPAYRIAAWICRVPYKWSSTIRSMLAWDRHIHGIHPFTTNSGNMIRLLKPGPGSAIFPGLPAPGLSASPMVTGDM